MKKWIVFVVAALLLVACQPAGSAVNVEATAQAVYDEQPTITPQPTATPQPFEVPEARATAYFNTAGIQTKLFARDKDVTDQVDEVYVIRHGGTVHFGYVDTDDSLSDEQGVLYVVPPVDFGPDFPGTSRFTTGAAAVRMIDGSDSEVALCFWERVPNVGRWGIFCETEDDATMTVRRIQGIGDSSEDWPWNLFYGIEVRGSLPLIP